MATAIEHGASTPADHPSGTRGNHTIEGFPAVADSTARAAITQVSSDRGRVVKQTGGTLPGYYVADGAGGWVRIITGDLTVSATQDGLQPQSNRAATAAPSDNDDASDGYAVGSYWCGATLAAAYVCLDATTSQAKWAPISGNRLGAYSITGNVGSGEDTLATQTLPANMVKIFGRGLRIRAWGHTANNANAKTVKLYFGTATILTNALTTSVAGKWVIDATIMCESGTNFQDYVSEIRETGVASSGIESGYLTENAAAPIVIKVTGTATADDDIVCRWLLVDLT